MWTTGVQGFDPSPCFHFQRATKRWLRIGPSGSSETKNRAEKIESVGLYGVLFLVPQEPFLRTAIFGITGWYFPHKPSINHLDGAGQVINYYFIAQIQWPVGKIPLFVGNSCSHWLGLREKHMGHLFWCHHRVVDVPQIVPSISWGRLLYLDVNLMQGNMFINGFSNCQYQNKSVLEPTSHVDNIANEQRRQQTLHC